MYVTEGAWGYDENGNYFITLGRKISTHKCSAEELGLTEQNSPNYLFKPIQSDRQVIENNLLGLMQCIDNDEQIDI